MNSTLTATIFGLLCLVLWGTGSWLLARASKKNKNAFQTNLSVQLPAILGIGIISLFYKFDEISVQNGLYIFLGQLSFLCAFILVIKALEKGPAGIVVPLENTFPLYLLFLSIIFLGQKFSGMQILAVVILVAGAMAVAYDKAQSLKKLTRLSIDKELAIGAAIMWGIGNFFINVVVDQVSWQSLYVIGNLISLPLTYIVAVAFSKKGFSVYRGALKDVIAIKSGILLTIGSLALYIGGNIVGSVVIILAIASGQPLITALLSRIFDNEVLHFQKRLGAVLIVAGIVILNIS